jgi:hypothetical protein
VIAIAFLSAVENSRFAIWVRESGSLWSYPTIIFLHSLGLTLLAGMNAAVDLRLLGFAPRVPLAPMKEIVPVMWFGFWISSVSGVALLAADATSMMISPVFYVKMACIAAAVITMVLIRRFLRDPPGPETGAMAWRGKVLGATSLALWVGAITAGRLTAYLGPVAGLKGP